MDCKFSRFVIIVVYASKIAYLFFYFIFVTSSMAYGNEHGLVIVDIIQKICLLNVASPDLYGAQDPYSRAPRSPKRVDTINRDDQARSPSIDQVSTLCQS